MRSATRLAIMGFVVFTACLFTSTSRAEAAAQCSTRYALAPSLVSHDDDSAYVHAAGSLQYCPLRTQMQIAVCVQRDEAGSWVDRGCETGPRTTVSTTKGGRGSGLSFDAPCVSGTLRTDVRVVWGGDGGPPEWSSGAVSTSCPGELGLRAARMSVGPYYAHAAICQGSLRGQYGDDDIHAWGVEHGALSFAGWGANWHDNNPYPDSVHWGTSFLMPGGWYAHPTGTCGVDYSNSDYIR